MVTYYQGHAVLVTHDVFETQWPNQQQFRVSDLQDVHVIKDSVDQLNTRSIGAAGALLIVVAASWPLLHSPSAWLIAVLLAATPGVIGGAYYHRNRPTWALRATYRGHQVELYSTNDVQTFGQVKRALIRAMEANIR